MRNHLLRNCLVIAALLCLAPAWRLLAAPATTVVGDGTPASCTAGALATAVAAGGAITFACGPAPATITINELTVAAGQTVTIDGGHLITLSGGGVNRHFTVAAGATLTLRALVLTDGAVTGSGGAIYNEGQLTLDQVTLRNNQADGDPSAFAGSGGAIFSGGAVEILSSRLIANRAIDMGGAIAMYAAPSANPPGLRVDDVHFEGNVSGNGGGAAYLEGSVLIQASTIVSNVAPAGGGLEFGPTGEFVLHDTTIARNQANTDLGGGIYIVGGAAEIKESVIEENSSLGGGGGIYVNPNYGAAVTVTDTTIRRNRTIGQDPPFNLAGVAGGGIYNGATLLLARVRIEGNVAGEAAGLFNYSEASHLTVRDTAIVDNHAAALAGGLWSSSADVQRFVNVTISGNRADLYAGGAYFSGGGAALAHVTLADNQAFEGANLYLSDAAALTLTNSIVASPGAGLNCAIAGISATLHSGGGNIASDDSCALTGPGDLPATDPLLAPLADNGGATLTHLPQPGSPAIDLALEASCPIDDQRGFMRPVGAGCDSGAVEVGAIPPIPAPVASPTPTQTPTLVPPTATPTAAPTATLPAVVVPAQPAGALVLALQVAPVSAAPGVTVTATGMNATGATALRLQWQFGGAMFFAANEGTAPGGAFNVDLPAPDEGITGPGKLCATALDVTPAAFTCVDFTLEAPAAGAIDGQIAPEALPPTVRAGAPDAVNLALNVKLLNQAGTAVSMAPVTNAGKFLMNNIPAGVYQLAAVGELAQPVELTNVTVVAGSIIRPTLPPYVQARQFDPVDGSPCDNKDAAAAAVQAKYAFNGTISGAATRAADLELPLLANQLLLNDLHRFRIQQTFGIYLSGIRVDNEFTGEAQALSANPVVAMNFRIVANGVKLLDVNRPAPYVATFNMGLLPAGRHKIYVAPVVQRDGVHVRQCPLEKEILVANSPLNLVRSEDRAAEFVGRFDPATGTYTFDTTPLSRAFAWPSQPTNYPYVGDLQSIVTATARLSGAAALSGACRITNAYVNSYVRAAGEYLCSPMIDLRGGNNSCVIDPLNPGKTTYTVSGKNICAPRIDKVRYEGDLFNFLDLVSLRLRIALRLDANVLFFSRIKPFAPELYTSIFADARPTVAGSLRLNFLRVLRPHARLTADGVSWIQPRVTLNTAYPLTSLGGCAAGQLYLTLWLEGIIGPQYFALADRTECININTARQAQPLTPQQAAELGLDPGPRVHAAPALASAPDGRMISVVVEDTTPNAENATPAIFARFWDPAAQTWGAAVQISGADRLVNDPVATFYGADGEQALVAWSQIELTPAELAAVGSDLNAILAHQEIFYARWDGAQWLAPQRLTDDLMADGLAAIAGDASGATLAWTRDNDGDLATTLDSLIAVSDWNSTAQGWDAPTFLSAGDGTAVVTAAMRAGSGAAIAPAAGLNYDVALDRRYYPGIDRSRTVVALTFDSDGDFNSGDDRTVRIFQRDFDAVQVNPQPLPPKDWRLVNPQPLPPRIQTPSIALDRGNLNAIKLAFTQLDATDTQGGVASIDQPGVLWSADLRRNSDGWQTTTAPLLENGAAVRGEEPRLLSGPGGAGSLVFRRFGAEDATASLGQLALSSGIIIEGGRTQFGAPVALTNSAGAQQWMPAATLNPATNALHVSSVQRSLLAAGSRSVDALAGVTPGVARAALLVAADDPVLALTVTDRTDPALEAALQLDRIHAPVGAAVQVTANGRNLGRQSAAITVRFFRGAPGSGAAAGEVVVGEVAPGASFAATLPLTVQTGDQPIFAVVVAGDNASTDNDSATGNLAAMPAPAITAVDNESALENSLLVVVEQPDAEDLAGFRLLRGTGPAGPFTLLAEFTEPLYLDLGLTAGATYCYRAQVYDTRGNLSPPSEPVCGAATVHRVFLPTVSR